MACGPTPLEWECQHLRSRGAEPLASESTATARSVDSCALSCGVKTAAGLILYAEPVWNDPEEKEETNGSAGAR